MIPITPPVEIPKPKPMTELVVEEKEYEDIKPCKTEAEAKDYQSKHGGIISTDGNKWWVLYIPKEK